MENNNSTKEFVLSQIQRNIVSFYKDYIILAEELKREHSVFLKKIEKHVPEEYIKDVDYFDSNRYNYLRKRVLDLGNELNRDLERYFELLNVELNHEALDEAQKLRLGKLMAMSKSFQATPEGNKLKVKGKIL